MSSTTGLIGDDGIRRYLNNPNLRAANQAMQLTKDQVAEWMKCKKDPEYFIENYIRILDVDSNQLVPFKMRPFQKELISKIHKNRFTIGKVSRQVGKTTAVRSYIIHQLIFFSNMRIGIFANKGEVAKKILEELQRSYELLPIWMQQGIVEWNKHTCQFENGSTLMATATASSSGRSGTYNMIMLDEFAFVDRHIAEDFFTSVYPTISSGSTTKVVMISTPKGMNLFFKFWNDAIEKRNGYVTVEGDWRSHPNRDEAWKKQEMAILGDEKFRQEHECEFIGSSNTLISPQKLKELSYSTPLWKSQCLSVYEDPHPDKIYMITVDCAHGQGLDYSTFSVFDCTQYPYKQVCAYRDKNIDPNLFPTYIYNAAKKYNDAFVLIENNDIGASIVNSLHADLEYENIFSTMPMGRGGQQISSGFKKGAKLGVRTTSSMKKIACANIKSLIENDKLLIRDFDTISELNTFVADKQSFSAEEGANDDLVMTLVLFGWLNNQALFKDLTNNDIRKKLFEQKMNNIQEQLLPFGIICNGEPEPEQFVDAKREAVWTVEETFGWVQDDEEY